MHKAFFHGVIAATVDLHQEAELRSHHGRASNTARGQHEVDRVQVPRSVEDLDLAPERRISKTTQHLDGPGLGVAPGRRLASRPHRQHVGKDACTRCACSHCGEVTEHHLVVPKRMLDGELHELVNGQRSAIAVPASKRRETNREMPQDKADRCDEHTAYLDRLLPRAGPQHRSRRPAGDRRAPQQRPVVIAEPVEFEPGGAAAPVSANVLDMETPCVVANGGGNPSAA